MKTRGFEVAKGYEDKNVILPVRGTAHSAGYDFHILNNVDVYIHPQETIKFHTGVKSYMQDDEVLLINIRSSVGIKKSIVLSNIQGVIDSDFYSNPTNDGEIMIALTNIGDKVQVIESNARVAQGIFMKYLVADKDEVVNEKRTSGIGSTGI